MTIRDAADTDVDRIHATLSANAGDTSLFQQSARRVRRDLGDFVVAVDGERILGCAALHWHRGSNAEILAVAVAPDAHGRGVGGELMRACIDRALSRGATFLWLATQKPGYFGKFGFVTMSKWRLPWIAIGRKLRLILEQPARRWLPALFGRHTFMRLPP
jgi:amino-acid N-acetyltransferase